MEKWRKLSFNNTLLTYVPKDMDGMANSADPDQTAPKGTVWLGSALFAHACLSENLGSLWLT